MKTLAMINSRGRGLDIDRIMRGFAGSDFTKESVIDLLTEFYGIIVSGNTNKGERLGVHGSRFDQAVKEMEAGGLY